MRRAAPEVRDGPGGAAIQAKLDALINASRAEDVFVGIEHLSEEEVEAFRKRCEAAAHEADHRDHSGGKGDG